MLGQILFAVPRSLVPVSYTHLEPLEVLPVGVRSCVSIVYIFGNTFKFSDMLLVKVIEQITLVDDAVAVILSLFQVLLGEPDVCAQPPAADGIRGRETLFIGTKPLCYMTAAQNKFLRIYYARVKECLEAFDERQDTVQN